MAVYRETTTIYRPARFLRKKYPNTSFFLRHSVCHCASTWGVVPLSSYVAARCLSFRASLGFAVLGYSATHMLLVVGPLSILQMHSLGVARDFIGTSSGSACTPW